MFSIINVGYYTDDVREFLISLYKNYIYRRARISINFFCNFSKYTNIYNLK